MALMDRGRACTTVPSPCRLAVGCYERASVDARVDATNLDMQGWC
jgi:hypothetical protein